MKLYRLTYEQVTETSFFVLADDPEQAKAAGRTELDYDEQEWERQDRDPTLVLTDERSTLPGDEEMWVQVKDHVDGGYSADAAHVARILAGEIPHDQEPATAGNR